MSALTRRSLSALCSAVAASALALAPQALADPPALPDAGDESAASTVGAYDDANYDVQLQYENGVPDVPLSQCTVTNIDTSGNAGDQPLAFITINCASTNG
ncbi:MAG TPA: hypothetical protein DEP24_11890 [Mycobacterium sp.]|jgi:hypothetical protein|nr:hypothetical protein [Mycobacterium sp.]